MIFEQFLYLGLGLRLHLFQDVFGGLLFQLGQHVGGLVRGHFFDDVGGFLGFKRFQDAGLHIRLHLGKRFGRDLAVHGFEDRLAIVRAQVLDDVGQVGRVHALQQVVTDVEAQAALRIGFDDAAVFPANGMRGDEFLQAADQLSRQHALRHAAEDAAQADVHVDDADHVVVGFMVDVESDVGDAHHFAALAVDDLLVEQVAHQAQHVLVGVVRRELFVFEEDAFE